MDPHQPTDSPQPTPEEPLTQEQARQLADKQRQESYRKAHLEQLRQQQCPGCGEYDLF